MIHTEHLVLRAWQEEDAADLYRYASDSRVSEMALWPRHTSVEMSRTVITDFFMTDPYIFAIVLKSTGEAIGCIGLVPSGEEHYPALEDEREVGYWIGYPHWGKGFTTEALESFIVFCNNSLSLRSLLITTDIRNKASQRVAEKCGFDFIEDYRSENIDSKAYRIMLDYIM